MRTVMSFAQPMNGHADMSVNTHTDMSLTGRGDRSLNGRADMSLNDHDDRSMSGHFTWGYGGLPPYVLSRHAVRQRAGR